MEGLEEGLAEMQQYIERAAQEAQNHPQGITEGRLIFEHVREKSELYTILLRSQGTQHIRHGVRDRLALPNDLSTAAK